ncbi:hypothetical protein CRUP_026471 [Coryphaenoides rupestris]|nr:hypothetical protein CRUP_026471 [Coryphaenoides rupestris]
MERRDCPDAPIESPNNHDPEDGSSPPARHESSLDQLLSAGDPQHALVEPANMRRNDDYLPVPGEEKCPDGSVDFCRKPTSEPRKQYETISKIQGIGFLKIHAPWNILCREAEFLKLKMPTKKVYEVKQGNNIVENIRLFIHKVTAPLHPNVDSNPVLFMEHWKRRQMRLNYLWDLTGFEEEERLNSLAPGDRIGPYFADGQRRVDYVLAYHIKKPDSGRRKSSHPANNGIMRRLRRSMSMRSSRAPLQPREDPEIAAQEQQASFLKIHAPWNILCREAEFLKLKMPTKKVYEVKQGNNIVENIRLFIHKVTAPLHPNVDSNRTQSVKPLSHPFSREKQHLFDLSDRDSFFGSKTRSFINEKVKLTCTDRMPAYLTMLVTMAFMITVTFAIVFGVILYRITIKSLLHVSSYPTARSNIRATVKTTAAIINLIAIIILDEIYGAIARWLTKLEVPKTEKSFEERLIFKTFILKFVNAFTPIVYLAFFRGRLVGRPGSYLYVVGSYRMEEETEEDAAEEEAFVISFTSDFIPRLVYQYMYSSDGSMHGFVNHTLSYFNTSDFQPGTAPLQPMNLGYKVILCRYKDYREPPGGSTAYEFTKEFWAILAARLAFVIVFQNVVMLMSDFIDWLIPDIPKDISLQIHKEKILMVDLFMKEEQSKWLTAGGGDDHHRPEKPPATPSPSPPKRVALQPRWRNETLANTKASEC